jgi:proteasome accessory factor C
MSRTASRLTRILAMLPWVIGHPGATVDEVCERFGYTPRELLSDLDLVFVCGLPGYGPGDLMVAYVEDDTVVVDTADYFARAPRLSPAESLALLAAGLTVVATGQASAELRSAVDKLTRVIVPEGEEVLTVDVMGSSDLTASLRDAAAAGRAVEIDYLSLGRGRQTTRIVEPWAVSTAMGNWYLTGFCRSAGGERVFRLDRIRRVQILDETFVPPSGPPTAVGYTPAEDDVHAVIKLYPAARWVAEYYPVDVIGEDEAGATVRFAAYDPMVAARLLIRLGDQAELVEGDEVRAALDDLRRRMLQRYEN